MILSLNGYRATIPYICAARAFEMPGRLDECAELEAVTLADAIAERFEWAGFPRAWGILRGKGIDKGCCFWGVDFRFRGNDELGGTDDAKSVTYSSCPT